MYSFLSYKIYDYFYSKKLYETRLKKNLQKSFIFKFVARDGYAPPLPGPKSGVIKLIY